MVILFAPSEGKREGGSLSSLNPDSLIFPQLYPSRYDIIREYESLVRRGSDEVLSELFGIKDPKEFERYKTSFEDAATMKAIERYDGVAYDYLDYSGLPMDAQGYIDTNVILFSNLFGPIRAADAIPDYKLKQGVSIEGLAPEKHYKEYFSGALDTLIGDQEVLDLRAGYYDKFYVPKNKTTTLKFLKDGKAVSHWAKAYRGSVLREAALHQVGSVEALLALDIKGLMLHEMIEKKNATEVIYTII